MYSQSRLPTARTRSLSPSRARGFFSHHPSSRHGKSSSPVQSILKRPIPIIASISGFVVILWLFGFLSSSERVRLTVGAVGKEGGLKVVARDWNEGPLERYKVEKKKGKRSSENSQDEVILFLTPMRNSIEHIWHYFHMLDTLTYPRHLLQLGILVSDTSDRTYARALELADERQYRRSSKERYGRISVFNKDFLPPGSNVSESVGDNVGKQRHEYKKQIKRREVLARSRTWLLAAAMREEVDWVVWLDVDVVDYEKDLLQTLLGWARKEAADVVVPNCMWKTYNEMGSYDRNNWQETKESLEYKRTLPPEEVLIEGYKDHPTHRLNMADMYPMTPLTPSSIRLDGVGGCTCLVKADVHREGAIFPAWPVDHQLETEGFAQIAKRLGKRLIGLPAVYVYHGLYG